MKAGLLRHRVTVQGKAITGTGDRGQTVFTWVDALENVPACIEELSGRRLELARQLIATATHEITIRYWSSLDVLHRVVDEAGNPYYIGAIIDRDKLHFTQVLMCSTQEAGA
jgi:SPP1 family predicted phage head-tail adaptor